MVSVQEFISGLRSENSSGTGQSAAVEQDKELIAWADKTFKKLREERILFERQWYVNLAFYFGRQNIAVIRNSASTTGFQLVVPKAPPWRVRIILNHIRRVIRTETAKLTSQKPRPFVVPNTTEDEDLAAARVGEQIVEARFSTPETRKILRSWVWWGSSCGTSFLKMYFDKNQEDANGDKGKICIDQLKPFEIFVPDLLEEEIEKQKFVIHANTKDVRDVKNTYGVEVQPDSSGVSDMLEDQFLHLVGAQQVKKDRVLVLEYWVKPGGHPMFPKGGMFVVGGGKLLHLQKDGLPYKHNQYPFYKFDVIPTGRFYGDSIIVDTIPIQREINRTRSQILEAKNLMAKPKLIGHQGAVNPKLITSEPGQYIAVTPGFELPQPMQLPPLPQYVLELESRLTTDMDDLSGQHEITRGQNPSQVTAATALSYLQEQDDTKLAYPVASIEDAISKLGNHYLKLVTQFWTTPKLVKTVGRDQMFEVQRFQANDLKGNTDVRVEAGSALPRSKAAKQAYIMELAKFGGIPQERMLEMLDLQGIDKIYEESLVDKRQAQRENMKMSKLTVETMTLTRQAQAATTGEMDEFTPIVDVNEWDNHQVHIYYHNLFRKSQDFELLPDEVKAEFDKHVLLHRQALMEGTAPAQAQMQAELEAEETPPEEQLVPVEGQEGPQASEPQQEAPGQVPGQLQGVQ